MYVHASLSERFWSKVEKLPGPNACWLWRGARCGRYGTISVDGRQEYAHRVGYELQVGPITDGLLVCHDCPDGDNPLCVRGSHCFLGTNEQNFADMRRKRRHTFGERHPHALLTEDQVRWVRSEYSIPGVTLSEIAFVLDVKLSTVGMIIEGRTWKHVTDGSEPAILATNVEAMLPQFDHNCRAQVGRK